MSNQYQRTFEVAVPTAAAWRAFTEPAELEAWYAPEVVAFDPTPGGKLLWRMPGYPDVTGEVDDAVEQRMIRWREWGMLPDVTEVTVVFEAVDSGTKISITHAGFGDGGEWSNELESHALGWDQCIADLILLLERGVRMNRHQMAPRFGVVARGCRTGVEVVGASPGKWGERVGLRPGDLLLAIGRTPLYSVGDLWNLTRAHDPGERLEAVYVRGRELHRVTAAV